MTDHFEACWMCWRPVCASQAIEEHHRLVLGITGTTLKKYFHRECYDKYGERDKETLVWVHDLLEEEQ